MKNALDISPPAKLAVTAARPASETPPKSVPLKRLGFLKRRSVWLIAALLVAIAIGAGCFLEFGKAKVRYVTAPVVRGDVESTVVAAGIVQPIKYVDVGAQTSGKLKSLKVIRGDEVKEDQLLAEIDPVLANTAITSANAALESMTALRAVKQAVLVLAKVQKERNDELFAKQLVSGSDRDITQSDYDVALADVNSLTAQMKEASAAIDTAKANLGYTNITAPGRRYG